MTSRDIITNTSLILNVF